MRINQFIARVTGMSRRAADQAIEEARVTLNGQAPDKGADVSAADKVTLDGRPLGPPKETLTIMLNKPVGYVCSRDGQGSRTVYDLLPPELERLKPVGRLDKDSSGLLLMTDDGGLANRLTHPRYAKEKVYEIELDKPLSENDAARVESGVELDDGASRLRLERGHAGSNDGAKDGSDAGKNWTVTMKEGRNRQIRRTFAALGYEVTALHRHQFGPHHLPENLGAGEWRVC